MPDLRRCSLAESRNATHQRRVFLPVMLATTVKQGFGTLRGLAADVPVCTHHIAYCSHMCSLYAHVNSPASCILVTWHLLINTVLYHFVVAWRIEVCTGCWWGSLRERGHWEDQDVDGRIILKWIFRKLEGVAGTGWSWLRIGTGGGHLWVRRGTFGFHKCGEFLD